MALRIDHRLTARALVPKIERLFDLAEERIYLRQGFHLFAHISIR